MRAQVIRSNNVETFHEQINSFIAGKKVIDIKYTLVPVATEYKSGVPSNIVFYDSALILYEGDKCGHGEM